MLLYNNTSTPCNSNYLCGISLTPMLSIASEQHLFLEKYRSLGLMQHTVNSNLISFLLDKKEDAMDLHESCFESKPYPPFDFS